MAHLSKHITFESPSAECIEKKLRGLACTQWQNHQDWIIKRHNGRKMLIEVASVHYPEPKGNASAPAPLTSISHHITVERLKMAMELLKEETAPGLDDVDLATFKKEAKLDRIVWQVRSRHYQTSPLLRVLVKKQDNTFRPLGIPCVSDRVVQRAYLLILEETFDREFLDCSYGYRQGRGCHQALTAIAQELNDRKVVYALDADFTKFFDHVEHARLMGLVKKRVTDPAFLKFCWDTLKSPVLIQGKPHPVHAGTPQGGVLSPLLANLYAHEALDLYYQNVVAAQLTGWSRLFRYADDFVILTESKEDAEQARHLIGEHVREWGQELHPEKTHIRDLRCPGIHPIQDGEDERELLFLGYQLHWHKAKGGAWEIVGRTAPGRVEKALERWRLDLKKLAKERTQNGEETIDALCWSIILHVRGFGEYYKAEGNHPEIRRYERGVFQDAAVFWTRYIDARSSNPFHETRERIWATIQMKPMCKLSNK